jgi:hypothetical protein
MPKLKICLLFFHTTLSDDRAKRVLSNGMLLASGKWNGEKLLNKYWIGLKSHLSKNWRFIALWWAILLAQGFFLAICNIFVVFWVYSVIDSHRYLQKNIILTKKFIFSGPGHPTEKADALKCYRTPLRSMGECLLGDLKHS